MWPEIQAQVMRPDDVHTAGLSKRQDGPGPPEVEERRSGSVGGINSGKFHQGDRGEGRRE